MQFARFFILTVSLALAPGLAALDYQRHELTEQGLVIHADKGRITLRFYHPSVVEAFYEIDGAKQLPSFTLDDEAIAQPARLSQTEKSLRYETDALRIDIQKSPLRLRYYRNNQLLVAEEQGLFQHQTLRGFRFQLQEHEKLLGAGQRVLGMDRRGHRLPLYNKAHYGYTTESEQMYFSLPAVLSSNGYMLMFDNSATGFIDLGKTEKDILQFEAVAGRTGYILATGDSYPAMLEHYLSVSGKPPLPPRWALGNYASRFGYRTEAEARAVVDKHIKKDFPLDAIVLDLYWFGPDIQGHMGNLDWDRKAFPNPEKMIADFRAQGVKTILISEPFVLTSSRRWQEAVDNQALALNPGGKPKTFDFYFGNTGLIDVFSPKAERWFWNIYRGLMQQGVSGWWGDLGEPEVHPSDTIHAIGTADEIHNAYGHQWAKILYDNHRKECPSCRPFIMMRAGALGSQRYGMIPWTGDVDRSWGGLEPQVELALQMSLFGFGYIHSDLGGFAGGEIFDRELYIRWLQYGTFQPVYRPHAQEHIAPEPVFHDTFTQDIVREFIKLRYRLLAYNYTLAYQHSQTGMPLMRPLFYLEPDNPALMDERNSYLWGDAFLVAPITQPGVSEWPIRLPKGIWFDYWTGARYTGDRVLNLPTDIRNIPVLVRAGAFIPEVLAQQSTDHYTSEQLTLHYYADPSVTHATGMMYEDDGINYGTIEQGRYELLSFEAKQNRKSLTINLNRAGDYPGRPESREVTLVLHNAPASVSRIQVNGQSIAIQQTTAPQAGAVHSAWYDAAQKQWHLRLHWAEPDVKVVLR